MATPSQSHLLRRKRRASVSRTAPTMPRVKKPMVYLESMPRPSATPIASHQRGSPLFNSRITKYAARTQQR